MANLIYLFNTKCQDENRIFKNKKEPKENQGLYHHIERRNFLQSEKVVKQKTTLIIYIFSLQFQEIIYKVAQLYKS